MVWRLAFSTTRSVIPSASRSAIHVRARQRCRDRAMRAGAAASRSPLKSRPCCPSRRR